MMKTVMNVLSVATVSLLLSGSGIAAELSVDLAKDVGVVRPELHSSGWAPRIFLRAIRKDDETIKAMNFAYARTHDWALVNNGQRVIDYQYIFPLFDKDPKDPSNYYFEATDEILKLSRQLGHKIFYRLGTSIECTGDLHFNNLVPKDFDKMAEIFAATIRHYNRGWANGHRWNIEYWEIWNEPEALDSMWCLPESEGGKDAALMKAKFVKFFVTVLKRLKTEFPEVKVGGPALCYLNQEYLTSILEGCKQAGVAPDFVSWHGYGRNPTELVYYANEARKLCDRLGFPKMELILNEYHYMQTWEGVHSVNMTPEQVKKAHEGPSGHNNIDAACFYLTALSLFQTSPLAQAYWYGCWHQGNWGYMEHDFSLNKVFYAAKAFGEIVRDYPKLGEVKREGTITTFVAKSADGWRQILLVTDYCGTDREIRIKASGLGAGHRLSAVVLDHTHNLAPCAAVVRDGQLVLTKSDALSVAFLVKVEP